MINASLVIIHQHTVTKFFYLVIRTYKIISLGNFQVYNSVLFTIVTMHLLPPLDFFGSLYLDTLNLFCHLPAPASSNH